MKHTVTTHSADHEHLANRPMTGTSQATCHFYFWERIRYFHFCTMQRVILLGLFPTAPWRFPLMASYSIRTTESNWKWLSKWKLASVVNPQPTQQMLLGSTRNHASPIHVTRRNLPTASNTIEFIDRGTMQSSWTRKDWRRIGNVVSLKNVVILNGQNVCHQYTNATKVNGFHKQLKLHPAWINFVAADCGLDSGDRFPHG